MAGVVSFLELTGCFFWVCVAFGLGMVCGVGIAAKAWKVQ